MVQWIFSKKCAAGNLDLVHCITLKLILLLYFVFSNSLKQSTFPQSLSSALHFTWFLFDFWTISNWFPLITCKHRAVSFWFFFFFFLVWKETIWKMKFIWMLSKQLAPFSLPSAELPLGMPCHFTCGFSSVSACPQLKLWLQSDLCCLSC